MTYGCGDGTRGVENGADSATPAREQSRRKSSGHHTAGRSYRRECLDIRGCHPTRPVPSPTLALPIRGLQPPFCTSLATPLIYQRP
jgi:hypothetical protein